MYRLQSLVLRFGLMVLAPALGAIAVGCQGLDPAPPQVVPAGAPPFAAPVVVGQPLAAGPVISPYAYGAPGTMVPQMSAVPGTDVASGVGIPVVDPTVAVLPNPLKVPVPNHDFAWDQIVDVVSEYFPIQSEQRVLLAGDSWTEGRIETPYQSGATVFEPQRKDTVGSFNRWQSTLQTIRRRAIIRVIPQADGYLVDLRVDKELEDLAQPEQSTAGAASLRTDNSLPSVARQEVDRTRSSPYWIALGRDTALEQRMLGEILERLATAPNIPMSVTPVQ
jgi:hypothetical protein